MGLVGKVIQATVAEAAEQIANQDPLTPPDPMRWVKRGVAIAILLVGWIFILWANRFHLTAATVFVCIGYLAIEVAVYNLFRTGAQAVSAEDESDSTWGRPLGAKGELEREKKTLLKAIKEAEFDREMGKLSTADAAEMIGLYRARAIEVIKELDKLGGEAGTVREQIEREVKARLELEARTKKPAEKAAKQDKSKKAGKDKKAAQEPANGDAKVDAKADKADAKVDAKADAEVDAKVAANTDAKDDATKDDATKDDADDNVKSTPEAAAASTPPTEISEPAAKEATQ